MGVSVARSPQNGAMPRQTIKCREPRARWGTDDSALPRYLPFCDVAVEARDLDGLVHGVRELLASLRT